MKLHRPLFPALAGLALLLSAAAPARAGEIDRRADEEMFLRAINGDEPTAEDQRRAQQLLRDWRLSEQSNPSGDVRTDAVFLEISEGRRLPLELANRAREMHRDYFTPEGRERHRARMATVVNRRIGSSSAPQQEAKAIDWLMPALLVFIVVAGVVVSALAGRRRPSDFGV